MTPKVKRAYEATLTELGEQACKLDRLDYYEFIEELAGHLEMLRIANKEEEEAS